MFLVQEGDKNSKFPHTLTKIEAKQIDLSLLMIDNNLILDAFIN